VIEFDELGIDGFAANPPNRCYLCKRELFSRFCALAEENGFAVVFDGSNIDDAGDYRPGATAVSELGVKSPLSAAGFGKEDIRMALKMLGLPNWDKQSFACLASRFVYGEEITKAKLDMVGKAEQFLLDRRFRFVRVRIHGDTCYTARIETLPEEIARLAADPLRSETAAFFTSLGFTFVSADMTGYRTGSMNAELPGLRTP
jgi:uncharacterized protein